MAEISLQGFLFGKPMPPTQFLAALAHHEALHKPAGLEGLTPASATEVIRSAAPDRPRRHGDGARLILDRGEGDAAGVAAFYLSDCSDGLMEFSSPRSQPRITRLAMAEPACQRPGH